MGSAAIHRAHSQNSNQHSPYSTLYASPASPDREDTLDSLLFSDRDDAAAFATPDNLSSCVQYLEPILQDLGLKQWQLHDGSPVAAVNRLYELVQQHQRVQEAREVAQDELHKAKVDAKVSNKTIQRLQGQVEAKQQELGALNIKLRQLDAWYRDETERWSAEREELCRKCGQLEQKHTQWQHELRRRDLEFEKLQKHLGTQISASERRRRVSSSGTGTGGSGGNSSTMVLGSGGTGKGSSSNTRSSRTPPNSARAAGGAASSSLVDTKRMPKGDVEDLYRRTVEAFEAQRLGLESENAALRKALHSLEDEHKELLNRTHSGARCSGAGDSSDCLHGSSPLAAGGNSSDGSPAAATALAGADPAAALHRMHTNLQALKVRKQRVTGTTPLSDLQQQAESASERLLLAKLQEAGRIMEEQESALALALKAISHSGTGA